MNKRTTKSYRIATAVNSLMITTLWKGRAEARMGDDYFRSADFHQHRAWEIDAVIKLREEGIVLPGDEGRSIEELRTEARAAWDRADRESAKAITAYYDKKSAA